MGLFFYSLIQRLSRTAKLMRPLCSTAIFTSYLRQGTLWMPSVRKCWYLDYLDRIHEESNLSMRGLFNDDQMTWTYRGPIDRLTTQEADVINDISSTVWER